MQRDYFIFSNGRLKRKDNTLFLINEKGDKKAVPIESIRNLYIFGEMDFNSKLFIFLNQNQVMVHIINYYGFYSGSFIPRETLLSGHVIVKQNFNQTMLELKQVLVFTSLFSLFSF